MSQLDVRQRRHECDTGSPASSPRATRSRTAGAGVRAAAASARQALLGLASTQLGVPVASLTVSEGRRLGRRQVRHLRRADRRQAVQRPDAGELQLWHPTATASRRPPEARTRGSRRRSRSASTSWSGPSRRGSTSRTIVSRHVHLRPQHPGAGDAARAGRAAARPGGLRRSALRSSRSTRARSSTSRACRIVRKGDFLGVVAPQEYDAIQAAAQLKVKWADPPAVLPGSGNEFKRMRALDSAGKTSGQQPPGVQTSATSIRPSPRRRTWSSQTLRLADERSPPRSVRAATVADVTPQGARIFSWHAGRLRDAGSESPRCSACR